MSYILEALNRSEQEKRNKKTPDLSTRHQSPPDTTKASRLPVWVFFIVLINLGALIYFVLKPESEIPPIAAPEQVAKKSDLTGDASDTRRETPIPKPEATGDLLIQPPVRTPRRQIEPRRVAQKSEAVRITELPLNVQRQIPDLKFSSHLYSDDSSFRMVNINGKMIREGDLVANGIKLDEITEEGVILSYLHYNFEVSVLQDWQFD